MTTSIVSNIDNYYRIAGAMIQRLCGNENGIYYDSGRLHSNNIHGFLRIFQRSESQKVWIASDDTWNLILNGSHELALRRLCGNSRRATVLHADWIFLIPQDRRDCNDIFWFLIGNDLVKHEIQYHKLHTAFADDQQIHVTVISSFLKYIDSVCNTDAAITWNHLPLTRSDCINTDSGIWICLLAQVIFHRLSSTIITPISIREPRPYIAMGLLEQKLPKFSDMLIRRMGTEVFSTVMSDNAPGNVHISGIYYPRDNELLGYIHSYNLLHDRYFYDPFIDDDTGHNDRHLQHLDGSQLMIPPISDDSKLKIRETCQLVHKTHRYFHTAIVDEQGTETHEIGCVEGRDIRDLIQPDMMSSNLLDFIFYSQFPSNDNQVTYVSSEVANAVLDCELNF